MTNSNHKCTSSIVNYRCLPNSFRCSYGACISASETCNGVFNCADGSDEDLNACTSQCIIPYPSDNTVYYSNGKIDFKILFK